MVKYNYLIVLICVLCSFWRCAQPQSLTGGPEDRQPPQVDTTHAYLNYQTNYKPTSVVIHFDEFIDLKQPGKQIIIFPNLEKKPTIYARGKRLHINFPDDEPLIDSATYAINFGESIVDYTASNPIKNFKYVFSTGDYIDSLRLEGSIIDYGTKEPVDGALAMLYENASDSIIYREKPYYFAVTDSEGEFSIENIKEGVYQLILLKDDNLNYLFDLETELIGFTDSLIHIQDVNTDVGSLKIFIENPELRIVESDAKLDGKVEVMYNKEIDNIITQVSDSSVHFISNIVGLKQTLWYKADSSFMFYFNNEQWSDSLKIRLTEKELDEEDKPLFKQPTTNLTNQTLSSDSLLVLQFDMAIDTVFPHKVHLYKVIDSTMQEVPYEMIGDSIALANSINIQHEWIAGAQYQLKMDSFWVTSIYNQTLDSSALDFSILLPTDYGTITVINDSTLVDSFDYIVHLKSNEKTIRRIKMDTTVKRYSFDNLNPGNYSLYILEDQNGNGTYDYGNYIQKRLPEKTSEQNIEELKKEWELEVKIDANKFKQ